MVVSPLSHVDTLYGSSWSKCHSPHTIRRYSHNRTFFYLFYQLFFTSPGGHTVLCCESLDHLLRGYSPSMLHAAGTMMAALMAWTCGPRAAPARTRQATMSAAPADAVTFSKYHGLGNDFVLVDCQSMSEPPMTPEQAAKMCDRNFGVGADGVIFVLPPDDMPDARYRMRIYNSDGSEPEMCGNGIRCMARFVADMQAGEGGDDSVAQLGTISTLAGPIVPTMMEDGTVRVDMGEPILAGADVPTTLPADGDGRVIETPITVDGREWSVTCVSMGNPHAIVFVDDVRRRPSSALATGASQAPRGSRAPVAARPLPLAREVARPDGGVRHARTRVLPGAHTVPRTMHHALVASHALPCPLPPLPPLRGLLRWTPSTSPPSARRSRCTPPSRRRPTRSSWRCSRPRT